MPKLSRDEHLAWCKGRALEYWRRNELTDAVASMLSDLGKHPESRIPDAIAALGLLAAVSGDRLAVFRFIEGFR